jgi:hypothetical protein
MRRILCIICPWYVLWRIQQHVTIARTYPPADKWSAGYERAMWEIGLNLGDEAEAQP